MRIGRFAAMALAFAVLDAPARAANLVGWVGPELQRIVIVNNSAAEQRQVRFVDDWETADYLAFRWRGLQGEMVYVTANNDRVAIDFPLTSAEIPRLFHAGQAGEITLGKTGRGPFLLGTAFGQRFMVEGSPLHCFSFQSSDAGEATGEVGLPRRVLYGYACSAAEQIRPEIEQFLRDVRFLGRGYVEGAAAMAEADAESARQFALGRTGESGAPRGLVDLPLGYAVWLPIGGS
jgi:hypothetical protein